MSINDVRWRLNDSFLVGGGGGEGITTYSDSS